MSATLLIAAIPRDFGIVCFLKSMLRTGSGCPDAQGEFLKFADVPLALSLEITERQADVTIPIISVVQVQF